MFQIEFYKSKNGHEPIAEYVLELDRKAVTSKTDRILLSRQKGIWLIFSKGVTK
jgi:hypothetical protein